MEVVGVYARLSKLRGRTEKIDTQHDLGTEAAAGRWPGCEVRLYADPDASGEREDVVRDDYERLKSDILSGVLTQVATSDQERLTRRPDELERLITVFRAAGIPGFLGYRDGWTSVVAGQSAGARYKGVGAKEYVEGMRVKTNERLAALAAVGRPGPGTSLGYRHQRDTTGRSWLVVDEAEAAAARWGAEMLLSGWTDIAVARAWDERGIEGRRGGGRWAGSTGRVMRALTSPTIAGKRVHRGEIVADGEWEPILDEVTWRRLCALAGSRKGNRPARRYLLTSGLAVCGECDHDPLKGMAGQGGNGRRRSVYSCHKASGGCGRVQAAAESLESCVVEAMLRHLDSADFRKRIATGDGYAADRRRLAAALGEVDTRRRGLAARWGRNELEDDEWDAARQALAEEKARLNAELAALPVAAVEVDLDAVRDGWEEMTFDERRHALRLFLSKVEVSRSQRRGPVFDATRVAVFDRYGEKLPSG